ncbi:MAG: ring-cleaving dioxygenase [Rhodothermales bacterium]|nr:ring-cleaving dioxygenase [Rhodothermales bacterium]
MMRPTDAAVHGIHHVTAIAGDAQENLDFYTGVLGLRLVKKSINQDAPDTYHLFFADAVGTPGTDLTFFPWPKMGRAQPGAGMAGEVTFAVPTASLDFWQERLAAHGVAVDPVETRFGEAVLPFADPHGLRLALVTTERERPFTAWAKSPVPAAHQLRGMDAVRMTVHRLGPTERLLTEALGFEEAGEEAGWHRYRAGRDAAGTLLDVVERPDAPRGRWGTGGVHHVAWRVADAEEEGAVRARVARAGLQPTPFIDRFWFQSVYFREPGGVLFELATDGPGFGRDEDVEHLGEALILPPWYEERRAEIEAGLPPLRAPHQQEA